MNWISLEKQVDIRSPFEVTRLPLLCRLQKGAHAKYRSRTHKRLVGKPFRTLYRFAFNVLELGGEGIFTLEIDGKRRPCPFNARNTQFGALFATPSRYGYEPAISALVDVLLRGDMVFYDIGSNWGYYSLLAASNPGYRGQIHAFEPYPPTFRDLTGVVGTLGLDGRITCHATGFSDHVGTAMMKIPGGMLSGLARIRNYDTGLEVGVLTLDDLDLPDPDLIKIDVEDMEGRVFEGGRDLLRRALPFIIFENWATKEYLDECLHPIEFLLEEGYGLYVPVWRGVSPSGRPFHVAELDDLDVVDGPVLTLAPFVSSLRYLLPGQINLFAVPPARAGDLPFYPAEDGRSLKEIVAGPA